MAGNLDVARLALDVQDLNTRVISGLEEVRDRRAGYGLEVKKLSQLWDELASPSEELRDLWESTMEKIHEIRRAGIDSAQEYVNERLQLNKQLERIKRRDNGEKCWF